MTAYIARCAECAGLYEARNTRSRYCSDACRSRANRARVEGRSDALADLLRRSADALANGAPAGVVEELVAEARRLTDEERR
ncbi:hypothetical protein [Agromyces indicus]|uniref:Uncharacterized protein n=1 Tax=Agromyces indicus TaxID=758919 RepID=A0ABU1FJE9_9MICO|nr:hypothetical protein [Agromyces indicus]MDR5691872.1 hypothetical protein [Agromyces indicus]